MFQYFLSLLSTCFPLRQDGNPGLDHGSKAQNAAVAASVAAVPTLAPTAQSSWTF
jgi:hypothetical protein